MNESRHESSTPQSAGQVGAPAGGTAAGPPPVPPVPEPVPASAEVRAAERDAAASGRLVSIALVIGGIISLQFGASVAVLLFPRAGALGVVTLRLVVAALVLMIACRPKVRGYSRGDWATIVAFGVALVGMNSLFYEAIDRIPLDRKSVV